MYVYVPFTLYRGHGRGWEAIIVFLVSECSGHSTNLSNLTKEWNDNEFLLSTPSTEWAIKGKEKFQIEFEKCVH